MAMYMKTNGFEDELDEEATEILVPSTRTIERKHWLGIVVVVMGVMGLVGVSQIVPKHTSTIESKSISPLEHITMAHQKIMSVFSSRALADAAKDGAKFNEGVELLIKQVNQEDPAAMCAKASMTRSTSKATPPQVKVTLRAKSGKSALLHDKVQEIKKTVIGMQSQMGGEEEAAMMNRMISVSDNAAADEVSITINMPPGMAQVEDELKDGLGQIKPKFTASLCFGRTIEEMYDNKAENLVELPNGVEAKLGSEFSSLLFQALSDSLPRYQHEERMMLGMMKGIAKFKTRQEILYHEPSELGDAFRAVPSLKHELEMMQMEIQHGPPAITKHFRGFHELCDGVGGIQVTGLPAKYELDVTFTNFHPSAVLASMAQGLN